jgi:uncharacterized protein YprB with RNaseH-like and TPR domain
MGIRDRLKIYESDVVPERNGSSHAALEEIGFEHCAIENGAYRSRTVHKVADLLAAFGREERDDFTSFKRHSDVPDFTLEELLFFDLETTSLSIGTGTYPFLIGLGYLQKDSLVIDQYFMHRFDCEPAILKEVRSSFRTAGIVVTYNGKTFDMPLIKNRYRLNRVPDFPMEIPVVDLLYPCRRIFKNLYENCSLKVIEEQVLGVFREDDIPGWEIPDVFFSYQKYGETARLAQVVEHNRMDIESMVLLMVTLNRFYRVLERREFHSVDRRTLLNAASSLYRNDISLFMDLMEFVGNEVFQKRSLFKKYSTALKRGGEFERALSLWRSERSVFSLEELAKHYEHRERDYAQALISCQAAMELLDRGVFSVGGGPLDRASLDIHRNRFFKRINRLHRKKGYR